MYILKYNFCKIKNKSFKYQRFAPLCCNDNGIRKFQFLYFLFYFFPEKNINYITIDKIRVATQGFLIHS